jgi:hypothetical protein
MRLLWMSLAALACASSGPGPDPDAGDPSLLRDARTGLVVRVPEGWSVAPPGIVQQSFASSFAAAGAEPPRAVFAVIESASIPDGRMRGVVALAGRNPGIPAEGASPIACAAMLAELRRIDPRSTLEGARTIGGRAFCGVRSATPSGQALFVWSTVLGADLLHLLTVAPDVESMAAADAILADISFTAPSSERPDAQPQVIRDARTGLRLEVPAGWSLLPKEMLRAGAGNTAGAAVVDQTVFALVRDATFTAAGAEVLGFMREPLLPNVRLPDSQEELCKVMLPFFLARDANARLEPLRTIGGLGFCSFRFVAEGKTYLLYAAVRDRMMLRFQAADVREDRSALEALLDAVAFD